MTSAEATAPEQSVAEAAEWRRLSPRMLLVHPVKEIGRAVPALVAVLVAGSGSGHGGLYGLAGAAVVAALALSRWFTTRYRVGVDQVQIREGLLRRRTLTARLDRVRTVDVTSHFLHRALGLARVEIGTGVSDPKGASTLKLDGLPAEAAARLRGELLHRSAAAAGTATAAPPGFSTGLLGTAADVSAAEEVEIAVLRPEWIRFAPFTLSGAFTALAVLGFGWRLVSESDVDLERFGPLHVVEQQLSGASLGAAVLEVVVAVVVFIGLASTARYLLAYWNFRLTRHPGGTFHVSRGLFTTRATSIEVSRLRGVEISETLLLRLVGGARTVAIATGLEVGRGASASGRGSTVLLPDAPLGEAHRVTGVVIGRPELVSAGLVGHGAAARRRRFSRAVGGAAALVGVVWLLWWTLGLTGSDWVAAVVLLPLAVPLAADRACNLGHLVREGFLVTQSGSLVRRRATIEIEAIIGWNVQQSFFQRRAGLATLVATTAAGRQSYQLVDMPLSEARAVTDSCLPGLLAEFR
ncbi:MAG: PH domain-containing protein [Nocardioidaceae bacterium]